MKLYASISSERATKGQGGRYLHIEVQDESKNMISKLLIESGADGLTYMTLKNHSDKIVFRNVTTNPRACPNGHAKTKENGVCVTCGYNTLGLTNKELKRITEKGEKKKSEMWCLNCDKQASESCIRIHTTK